MSNLKNPKVGDTVLDNYDKKKKKVMSIVGDIYFIGKDREPVRRHEFKFPA